MTEEHWKSGVGWVVGGALLTLVVAYGSLLPSPNWGSPISHTFAIDSHPARLAFLLGDVATRPTALVWFVALLTLFSALWLTQRAARLPGEPPTRLLGLPWLVAIVVASAGVWLSLEERLFYGGLQTDSGMGDVVGVFALGAAWLAATLCLAAVRGAAHLRRSGAHPWS